MAPELYLREIYPSRNILSLQETTTVSAAECQDALKKSDAAVSIVGEVATDSIAARMIQMGMTASIFTIFSHHANTPKDLVLTLRNSLVNDGGFSNMETAEKQVTDVVKCDIHLDYTPDGRRYIDRISEITQLDEGIPYPDYNENDPVNSMNLITKEYYQRKTDRVGFTTRVILKYDLPTNTYHTVDRFSEYLENRLKNNLVVELRPAFDEFMLREWGPRPGSEEAKLSEAELDARKAELAAQVAEIDSKNAEIMKNDADCTKLASDTNSTKSGDDIQREAEENELWKSGYLETADEPEAEAQADEAAIEKFLASDDFFDADDYS